MASGSQKRFKETAVCSPRLPKEQLQELPLPTLRVGEHHQPSGLVGAKAEMSQIGLLKSLNLQPTLKIPAPRNFTNSNNIKGKFAMTTTLTETRAQKKLVSTPSWFQVLTKR